MRHETGGNATVRGPPRSLSERHTQGATFCPQFIIIQHPSLAAAATGRSGTFLGRPVFVAAERAQPSNHNRKHNQR